jgi:hypothetical protein
MIVIAATRRRITIVTGTIMTTTIMRPARARWNAVWRCYGNISGAEACEATVGHLLAALYHSGHIRA